MNIGYARVSPLDPRTDQQIDKLHEAGCEEVFTEHSTGSTRARPELESCLRSLRKGDTLVVWRLDRLGRSLKDLVRIITELAERGVTFRSLSEAIDTSTSGGKLFSHIFRALGEFERAIIRERTRAGLASVRARGRKGGRKPKMTDSDIRKAHAMLKNPGMTKTEVSKHFGVSRVTLNTSLKRTRQERAL